MSFYMVTYGATQIEELYIGLTEEDVVTSARVLIDQWPEYAALSNEEVIEMARSGEVEFDLVEIHAPWPGENASHHHLIGLYEKQHAL
ncbi:hypothetical protein [Pseudomonas chlororaphis]|uniref:hypothetical protein n=1 Tax=Pseudomonas chlororaphis TaxID=587753 RepID=UPI0003D39965|nr:hypothetical protein [Pseudomonas chlororaphis]ETD37981.1 hypothetical protein U724_19180 [Pseudomonas chlororaphis subsp. aurantiaca PB-St2]QFS54522.1 hypothetical protein FD951_08100 [Pseudomonas chlororaphis subsp. aurantiaca]